MNHQDVSHLHFEHPQISKALRTTDFSAAMVAAWAYRLFLAATLFACSGSKSLAAAATLGEAVDSPNLVWVGESGAQAWSYQTSKTHDGIDAAEAVLTTQKRAVVGTTLQGPGVLSFWWNAERQSTAAGDPLVSGVGTSSRSLSSSVVFQMGTNLVGTWRKDTLVIPSGSQKVWWVLAPSGFGSTNAFAMKGWLDEVSFTKADGSIIADLSLAPLGRTRSEWEGLHYKRLLEIPDDGHHPAKDVTGQDADQAQSGPVWFLAGDWLGQPDTVRTITVPGDKLIFLEAWGSECSVFEGEPYFGGNEAELKACVEKFTPTGTTIVEVDGYQIPSLSTYRVTSPALSVTLPSPNVFGVPGSRTGLMAGNGFAVLINPLSPGGHLVRFGEPGNLITYRINVTAVPDGPPVILADPFSTTVAPGGAVNLSTAASGPRPLRFQWYLNEVNLLANATNATLKLTGVQQSKLGSYSVVVGNSFGSVTSKSAYVSFKVAPTIVNQPKDRTNLVGTMASFTVTVTNNASLPITYVWRKGTTSLLTNVLEERSCTFSVPDVTAGSAGDYSVKISNPASAGVQSVSAHLSVTDSTTLPEVTLTSPKPDQVFFAPAAITLTALASDADGGVDRVEYYSGGALLGSATVPPYSFVWEHVPPGEHSIVARAYDDVSGSRSTSPIQIRVLATGVTSPGSSIGGVPYESWAVKWWQWLYSIPTSHAPSLDSTGANAHQGQSGPVWFLAGTTDNQKVERRVVVPKGKYLFLPIINVINDYPCPDPNFQPAAGESLEKFLADFAASIIDTTTQLSAELDTIPITDFQSLRLRSGLFEFAGDPSWAPYDSCATNTPLSKAVSDGYWLMLDPLSPGEHVLRFSAKNFIPGKDAQGNPTLTPFGNQDVTYRLTVPPTSVLPPTVPVAGRTQAEWSAAWWQWALSQGRAGSPLLDITGASANHRQEGDVFFLAGLIDYVGSASSTLRHFSVPAGKNLFFPLVAATADNVDVEPPLSVPQLRSLIAPTFDGVSELFATVDGAALANLELSRQYSPNFSVILPEDNLYQSLSPGYRTGAVVDPLVSDGFWVMLEPLSPGTHTVIFGGKLPTGVEISVTNEITVVGAEVVPPQGSYLGKTLAQWTAEWWKWAASQTLQQTPIFDSNGGLGHLGQSGPVWFLASAQANTVERSLIIPHGKSLLFPTLFTHATYPCSLYSLGLGQTVEDLLTRVVTSQVDQATTLTDSQVAEVDGVPIPGLKSRRATSPLFTFVADASLTNGFAPCTREGAQEAVSDGYWIMLKPLTSGNHLLKFGARGDNGFYFDVTYHLTVLPPGVLSPKEKVADRSQEEWSAAWWRWVLEQSSGRNPLKDTSGAHANFNQAGPVFHLGGTFGVLTDSDIPGALRHFMAPAGKHLFFPLLNVTTDNTVHDPDVSINTLRGIAQSAADAPLKLMGSIDGVGVPNPELFRLKSPVFSYTLAQDNLFTILDPRYVDGLSVNSAIADGYWIMLAPLEPGTHAIEFGGQFRTGFRVAVRDYITVVPEGIPFITETRRDGDQLLISFWTGLGGLYGVDTAPDLGGPWSAEGVNELGDANQRTVQLSIAAGQRFVRVAKR